MTSTHDLGSSKTKAQGNPNVSKLPKWCIQLMMCFMRGFDKAMRSMFPPGEKYPNGMDSGAMEFCLFASITTAPILFFGWNFWLMMGVLASLILLNTVRYYLFYDIVDGKHQRKGNQPSSLTIVYLGPDKNTTPQFLSAYHARWKAQVLTLKLRILLPVLRSVPFYHGTLCGSV